MGLLRKLAARAKSAATAAVDADRVLMTAMAGHIEMAKSRYALDRGAVWRPSEPLRILLAGYSGTRNTGADVRVEEMIRQFRHLFGDEHLDLSMLTIDPALSRGYFRTVKQLHLPQIYPKFLYDTVHEVHGVIACEGSMFKSKFANALSTMMVGALGLAAAEGKLAIGYGGEAGKMDPALEALVGRYCKDAFIIARNHESREVLGRLGIESRAGTDTAWTFEPAPPDVGDGLLRRAGWNGRDDVLAICPINPFWWPVRPDAVRAALLGAGVVSSDSHYSSIYFHADSKDIRDKQRAYLTAIARAVRRFRAGRQVFPILVGMEQLDRRACEGLRDELGEDIPLFVSDDHDMYAMVSVIRRASMMLSSRYHAIVTSMPALVPSAGITMDERIRNLMADRGTPELALEVDDPELEERAHAALCRLERDARELRAGIGRCVVQNLERMGRMGMELVAHVQARHPELPIRAELGLDGDPWAHLPEMSEGLLDLVRHHAAAEAREVLRAQPGAVRAMEPEASL
jgi:polysaccharide pyruvyl transferase WcaK-like protein